MDGMLMEWEKMLPNPDEIDDIDHSDMMESELPIFEGKNQLPTVLDTTNTSDKGAGEITPKLGEITPKLREIKQVESRTLQDINKGEVTGDRSGSRQREMTSLLNLESEDNEKTVKLIDELNSLKDLDDIPKYSSQIAEASGEKNCKDCESVNTSGYATCQQTSNDSINDNKLKNGFENCVDSPLQISDVRTGDIPSQRALAKDIKDCGKEKETSLQRNIRLGYIIPDEDGQTMEGHGQSEVGCNVNALESGLHEKDTENEKGCNENVLNEDKRAKVFKQLKEHLKRGGFSEKENTMNKSKFDEDGIGNGNIADNKKDEISLSQNCDIPEMKKHSEISPLNNNITAGNMDSIRLNNNKAETSSAENTFVLLTVKDEPMDYEEYGKLQEFEKPHEDVNNEHIGFPDNFMSNFYSDMDSARDSEINYNEEIDYRCKITEAGLYQCLYCSSKLANSAQFQNHVAERHKTMYQCKHCDMNFHRSQDLAIHCRIRHTLERVKIQNMSSNSSPNKSIIRRRKSKVFLDEDGNQIYKCAHCSKKFRVQQAMASHVRNVHYNNSKEKVKPSYDDEGYQIYKCRYTSCDETFHRKLDLSLHVKTEHRKSPKKNKKTQVLYYDDDGIQIYKCRYCSEGFRIQQAMASHVRNVHRYNFNVKENVRKTTADTTDNPSSEIGESRKSDDEKLEESVREENETKTKSREFTKRVLPYRNMSFETDANQIEESLANSDCSLKRELKSNQIYHCSKCTKWFYREKQVFNHEKTCTGIKQEPALLDDNRQDFEIHDGIVDEQSNRVREGHVKKELKEKMDAHDVNKFKENMQQKKEKTRQNGHGSVGKVEAFSFLPKFFCKYCPSSYEEGRIMNLHLVKHLGEVLLMAESKYKCRICSKTFDNNKKMMYHLQNHTSFDITKLYKQPTIPECSICGQPFVNELLLKKHQNKHSKIDTRVMTPRSKAIAIDSTTTPSGRSNIKVIYSANGSNSVSNIRSKLQIESIGSTSLSSGDDSFSIVKEKTVSLDDIPFQCGMCLSRFPTSQYLLHHITLHMQGPYVFKIEMDKKEKEDEENGVKILPHGNISFAGRSRLLPTSIPKTVNDERNIHIVKSSTTSSDNPPTLKMPSVFKKCQEENIIHTSNSISGSQTRTKSDFTMHAIANDHMYTNSLLKPQKKDDVLRTGDDEMPSEDNNSDTESTFSSEAESSAYYDTDECEKIENDVRNKTSMPRKINVKKDTPSQRVSTFRKCFDIASGKWFECPYCLHISQTQRELHSHMQNHDLKDLQKMVQCCNCNRKFVSKWHLSKHMEHSHRRNSYKCSFCDKGFLTSFEVMEHVQKVHQY